VKRLQQKDSCKKEMARAVARAICIVVMSARRAMMI
jgi:hypothetical protein